MAAEPQQENIFFNKEMLLTDRHHQNISFHHDMKFSIKLCRFFIMQQFELQVSFVHENTYMVRLYNLCFSMFAAMYMSLYIPHWVLFDCSDLPLLCE